VGCKEPVKEEEEEEEEGIIISHRNRPFCFVNY
jgi:hypothetical protein